MRSRLPTVLSRYVAVALVLLLGSAAVTFGAGHMTSPPAPAAAPPPAPAEPADLVVPDVRNQVYVFAKGALEDAGFAWKVAGGADGYAANIVVSQSPAPGTRLVDTGAPLVTLTLGKNPSYPQQGEPENASPYPGTKLALGGPAVEPLEEASAAAPAPVGDATAKPAAKPKSANASKPRRAAKKAKPGPKAKEPAGRPPAFVVPGAPAEPLDEIALDERARRLAAWVEKNPKPTDANVRHWLYQHTWIVTGARFGWWRGREALELLVAVDRRVETLWGVGTKSRVVAEQALVEVRARS